MKINIEKKLRKIVNGNTEGFSMIELIMVLVIAGISMAIALPRLASVSQIDIYNAARQAKSDIRYTQELAMSKYRQTAINFASNSNTYTITSSGPTLTRKLPPSSNAIFDAGSTLVFKFNTFGEPIEGGGGILTIGGDSERIEVSSMTGTASILLNP